MRFDDRLATVLAQPLDDTAACVVMWRQIVDILAQQPAEACLAPGTLTMLEHVHGRVPQAMRAGAALALAGRPAHPAVAMLLAGDRPAVAAALIGSVRIDDGTWLALLPRLPVAARAMLRLRHDLSTGMRIGLACFGPSDYALPGPAAPPEPEATPATGREPAPPPELPLASQAKALLPAALEEMSSTHDDPEWHGRITATDAGIAAPSPQAFRFETGPDGVILWVDGVPRAALIGQTIARAAGLSVPGVDGQAGGVFRHCASFRDARLVVAGGSAAAGEWHIAGVPVFESYDGRFTGYRGTARRPRADGQAAPASGGLYGTGLPADSLRLLVHELRTPLNAIVGFGEMIERQILGPAPLRYRLRAEVIVEQGRLLLGVVDDLDMAARAGAMPPEGLSNPIAPADLLRAVWRAQRPGAAERGVALEMVIGADIGQVDADPATIERMYARLLAAAVGLGRPGERIATRLACGGGMVVLWVTRPAVLGDSSEAVLLDPGFTPEGDWPEAPLLGLGFSLRLVRNLAIAAGGGLDIDADGFVLRLPVAAAWRASGAAPR